MACLTSPVDSTDLPTTIRGSLSATLREAPASAGAERDDRLPLTRPLSRQENSTIKTRRRS
jgi:hypothetical protein